MLLVFVAVCGVVCVCACMCSMCTWSRCCTVVIVLLVVVEVFVRVCLLDLCSYVGMSCVLIIFL